MSQKDKNEPANSAVATGSVHNDATIRAARETVCGPLFRHLTAAVEAAEGDKLQQAILFAMVCGDGAASQKQIEHAIASFATVMGVVDILRRLLAGEHIVEFKEDGTFGGTHPTRLVTAMKAADPSLPDGFAVSDFPLGAYQATESEQQLG